MANKINKDVSLERDAKRYRWLRKQHWSDGGICVTLAENVKPYSDCFSLTHLDDTIDEEMIKKPHKLTSKRNKKTGIGLSGRQY